MKKHTLLFLTIVAVMSALVVSCTKSTPAPTAEVFFTVGADGYTVTFTATVTDVDTYSWNFGDGTDVSTQSSPVHTYAHSGEYSVVLTVKGGGGEATAPTKTVSIAASFLEMLTGGASAANGKTWVLDPIVTPGPTGDGGGAITPEMTIDLPAADNILDQVGLGAEYDNEFTFFANGNYTMNLKNGTALAGAVYGYETGTMQGEPAYSIGMCAATFTLPASATWTLHPDTENLIVDAITDPNTSDIPPVHANVTFTGKKWISLSEGAYFGILDFPTTAKFIVKEISATKMQVALFLCGYGYGDNLADKELPTNLIQLTYIPKSSK